SASARSARIGPPPASGGRPQPVAQPAVRPPAKAAEQWPARGSAFRASCGWLRQHAPIALEGAGDVVKQLQPAARGDRAAVAILADRLAAVRRQDDVRMAQALTKRRRAAAPKPLVADLGDLVDQVDIKVDREAGAKGEPGAHPGRIRIDWHVEVLGIMPQVPVTKSCATVEHDQLEREKLSSGGAL